MGMDEDKGDQSGDSVNLQSPYCQAPWWMETKIHLHKVIVDSSITRVCVTWSCAIRLIKNLAQFLG